MRLFLIFLLTILLYQSDILAFEQRVIFCPASNGSNNPTIYKTFLDDNDEAKISIVKSRNAKPKTGVPYYFDEREGGILVWSIVYLLNGEATIWNNGYVLERKELVERVAVLTKEEFNNLKNIKKNNPEKLEELKFQIFDNKKKTKSLKDIKISYNCKLEK